MRRSTKNARPNPLNCDGDYGAGARSDAIDLRQIQDFLSRRWKLILSTAAIVAAATYIALLAVTPRYTATVQVLLDPGNQKLLGAVNIVPELSLENANVDSQLSVISSINLLRRVVEQTKLTQIPNSALRRSLVCSRC